MNTVMLQQTVQTKYQHQAHLHDWESIILAWDTGLDPLLDIITGTNTGLADPDHIHAPTDTDVTVKITYREVVPGHITDVPTDVHHATDTPTLIITNGTHQIGGLPHIEALLHILKTAVGLDHILCTKLAKQHLLNLHTALTRQHVNTRIRN